MPNPFDAATKHLLETHPDSWLKLIGQESVPSVEVLSAELSTVTTEADKVLRVGGPSPWLAHFELQAGRDSSLVRRLLRYNVLLGGRHNLPVHSVAILLHPRTDGNELTGIWEERPPIPGSSLRFEYQVVRIWDQPVEAILTGGLGTLPLSPLADVPAEALPEVLRRLGERLRAEASLIDAIELWASTEVLLGLRLPREAAERMIRGISAMFLGIHGIEESSTYQAILAEGRAEGEARGRTEGEARGRAEGEARGRAEGEARGRAEHARKLLIDLGTQQLGQPAPDILASIEEMTDPNEIDARTRRVLSASSWAELLGPAPGP